MKKIILIAIFLLTLISSQGCLTFHTIKYELTLEGDLKGNGIIKIYDIRSGAETDKEFNDDKNTLFDYILKSDKFITDMHNEGKDIVSRKLSVKDSLLNGEVKLNFDDIRKIENIALEGDFYYLTLELEDSVLSTNGEIIFSDEYKRIVWDKNVKTLTFEMMAADYSDSYFRKLASYYKE